MNVHTCAFSASAESHASQASVPDTLRATQSRVFSRRYFGTLRTQRQPRPHAETAAAEYPVDLVNTTGYSSRRGE